MAVAGQPEAGAGPLRLRFFRCPAGPQTFRPARPRIAQVIDRTAITGRGPRRAEGRAEVHHRLREVAGALLRCQRVGAFADLGLGFRQRRFDVEEARHHAFDIAVDDCRRLAEGDGGDRGGRVGADAGEPLKPFCFLGKFSSVFGGYGAGAGMHVARAGIVAEPRPGLHHLFLRRCRQRLDRRPALQKARKIRPDGCHRRLLQHDFRQPDAVGIGALTLARTPGQHPRMGIVPGQQLARGG